MDITDRSDSHIYSANMHRLRATLGGEPQLFRCADKTLLSRLYMISTSPSLPTRAPFSGAPPSGSKPHESSAPLK
jgi:hypothetical protein